MKKMSDIVHLERKAWARIGVFTRKYIFQDMKRGILQGKNRAISYLSKKYKEYKANNMRRFSDNKRLKNYSGVGIASKRTNKVDMMLTGQTINGLKIKKVEKDAVLMGYDQKDADKILGNEKIDKNRDIRNLNSKNKKRIQKIFSAEFDRKIKQFTSEDININMRM